LLDRGENKEPLVKVQRCDIVTVSLKKCPLPQVGEEETK